jgi:glycosyltransferase involved in cell wall biosynthesis
MNIQILMATMAKSRIDDIDWKNKCIVSPLLLINQSDFDGTETLNDITMISKKERGSSKSRNLAIDNARGDICIIADDDVSYLENYESIVREAYAKYPDADIITFQIQTTEGKPFKSNYPSKEGYHTKMSILKCASIEITFKRKSVIESGLKLDLEFGLGSKYRVHDEIIFLKDALDSGLKCVYIPIPIVIHPPESSGTDYNEELLFSKGAAFYRLFGISGLLYDLAFSIKKYSEYKNVFSFTQCLKLMIKGTLGYSKEKN